MSRLLRLIIIILFFYAVAFLVGMVVARLVEGSPQEKALVSLEPSEKARGIQWVGDKVTKDRAGSRRIAPPQLLEVSDSVSIGEKAVMLVQSTPGALCAIRFTDANLTEHRIPELNNRFAGADGICRWEWRIPESAQPGSAGLEVCTGHCMEMIFFYITD